MSDTQPTNQLEEVDEALARYKLHIDAAIDVVLDQRVTNYPILVWQQEAQIEIGVPLIAEAKPGPWEVRISTLEELVTKKLIRPEKLSNFKEVFSNGNSQYCLLVISSKGAQFAFRPRG